MNILFGEESPNRPITEFYFLYFLISKIKPHCYFKKPTVDGGILFKQSNTEDLQFSVVLISEWGTLHHTSLVIFLGFIGRNYCEMLVHQFDVIQFLIQLNFSKNILMRCIPSDLLTAFLLNGRKAFNKMPYSHRVEELIQFTNEIVSLHCLFKHKCKRLCQMCASGWYK